MTAPALQQYIQGQGVVTADNLNTFEQTCDNLAQLRGFTGVPGLQVYVRGIATPGDGGNGEFYWNQTGVGPDDNLNTIVPTGSIGSGVWSRLGAPKTPSVVHGQCQLRVLSTATLLLAPMNGPGLQINGTVYQIPASGVTASGTSTFINGVGGRGLAVSTLYYVYVFLNSNVLTLDFWNGVGSGHMADTTAGNVGVEVRNSGSSPDSSRTFVGLIATDSSGFFQDSPVNRLCASWFNRTPRSLSGTGQTISITSTAVIEISTAARVNFVTLANTSYLAGIQGSMSNNTAGQGVEIVGNVDGVTTGTTNAGTSITANASLPAVCINSVGTLSEGLHYLSASGFVTGGTGTYAYYVNGLLGM